jgi:2-phospho-L-lactate guanylyltransferase
VLGDIPEITPSDVELLIEALPARGVAAAPSKDGGTSALALRPPDVIELRFGEQSFAAHRKAAARAGVEFREAPLERLSLDIDSPADLRELMSRPGDTATHRVLARLGILERVG